MFKCVQVCVRWSVDKKFLVFTQALCPQPILWSDYQGGSSSLLCATYFVIERRDAKIESRSKLKSHVFVFTLRAAHNFIKRWKKMEYSGSPRNIVSKESFSYTGELWTINISIIQKCLLFSCPLFRSNFYLQWNFLLAFSSRLLTFTIALSFGQRCE